MAQGALVIGTATERRPSGGSYRLLGATVDPISGVQVSVCNTNPSGGQVCQVALALVEPGYTYNDGDTPAAYQFFYQNMPLEPGSPPITIAVQPLPAGWRVVCFSDVLGANFFCNALTES